MSELAEKLSHLPEAREIGSRRIARPTARQWMLHAALFLITAGTTTICGIMMAGPDIDHGAETDGGAGLIGILFMIPRYYLSGIWGLLSYSFAHPAHESGHYLFCRYYGVDATLPFFIPQPPLLIPGTFGAFIRMKSPVPSRRALFDIGLAGPLAGFILIVPIAFAGVLTAHHLNIPPGEVPELTFNDPLLFRLIARVFRINLDNSVVNSFYLAAWVGSLVTALNLMPVGQLDGGHGTFALFGQRAHWWIGRVAFVLMLITTVFGWLWFRSPVMILYVVLLAVMLRVRHPQPEQMEPLGLARTIIGVITLIVFALCFLPFPITIG
ncbi:MAG: hypothetical protein DMF75_08550 [Acidobacteria bacterium]|nr:MAG: hypothetical protein DMF75_08550 [Acidobacteriota bacterium]